MKQPNNAKYSAALYMRLSRDDENFGDSVSIETQRIVLQKFAQENGLIIYDEYVDDGWSGTNFERPAFQRMMSDIEAGKVNCVVTKDLSRLGERLHRGWPIYGFCVPVPWLPFHRVERRRGYQAQEQ